MERGYDDVYDPEEEAYAAGVAGVTASAPSRADLYPEEGSEEAAVQAAHKDLNAQRAARFMASTARAAVAEPEQIVQVEDARVAQSKAHALRRKRVS